MTQPVSTPPSPVLPTQRLIVGLQPVREAIRAHGPRLTRVAVESSSSPRLEAVVRYARDQGVADIVRMRRGDLDRLARGSEHQGVVAWGPPLAFCALSQLGTEQMPLVLALDEIQDPQNFGAVLRSATGIAHAAVLWGQHGSAPLTTATFRASAGAVEHARLCRVPSLVQALEELRSRGATVLGLDSQAPQVLDDLNPTLPLVLVIGSEHRGLGRAVRRSCTNLVRLRSSGQVASLNASVAAGIALYLCSKSLNFSQLSGEPAVEYDGF